LKKINQQVIDIKYTFNLGQLIEIAPKLKQYLIHNFLSTKPLVPKLALVHVITFVAINHDMIVV
jgi:hypothetical protein